jgi:hypothetical protein
LSIGALYFWFSPPLGEYASEDWSEKFRQIRLCVPPINRNALAARIPLSSPVSANFPTLSNAFLGGRVTKHTIVIRLHGRYGFQAFALNLNLLLSV